MASNIIESFIVGGFTYELRNVLCGRKECSKCPHGPYWYMTFKPRVGKKVTKYLGKSLPEEVDRPCNTDL